MSGIEMENGLNKEIQFVNEKRNVLDKEPVDVDI